VFTGVGPNGSRGGPQESGWLHVPVLVNDGPAGTGWYGSRVGSGAAVTEVGPGRGRDLVTVTTELGTGRGVAVGRCVGLLHADDDGRPRPQLSLGTGGARPQLSLCTGGARPQLSPCAGGARPQLSPCAGGARPQLSLCTGGARSQPCSRGACSRGALGVSDSLLHGHCLRSRTSGGLLVFADDFLVPYFPYLRLEQTLPGTPQRGR
jgi:hypothetical protein